MKWVYPFDDGNRGMRDLLGGKGANLAEMTRLGLPVPPGFIISTAACNAYLASGRRLPDGLSDQVRQAMRRLERKSGKHFTSPSSSKQASLAGKWPLLVSVRSGAPESMPGMLETILNVGLNMSRATELARASQQPEFVHDSFRRLIHQFSRVVYHLELGVRDQSADIDTLLAAFERQADRSFPKDPYEQLEQAIRAVFDSWQTPKAIEYRNLYNISNELGTAVVIQAMVFGNLSDHSGTGVLFTRDPMVGAKQIFAEYLPGGQGEDVVSGDRTPETIERLKRDLPTAYDELLRISALLEQTYRDMQDIEFTIERGKLFILQTRSAKRTPLAAIKVAADMVQEGLILQEEAIERIDVASIGQVLSPRLENPRPEQAIAHGIASSPGAAIGRIAFTREQVRQFAAAGEPIIFVRDTISPDDVPVMPAIAGIVTREGGATSHAAVVARGLGKPCVVGCSDIRIDPHTHVLLASDQKLPEGAYLSIDGSSGFIFGGEQRLISMRLEEFPELRLLLSWAQELAGGKPEIYLDANTPAEVAVACQSTQHIRAIGLCRTDWMFYDKPFRALTQAAVLAEFESERLRALEALKEAQSQEFERIFTNANGKPVIVQLLTTPLDDVFPVRDVLVSELAELRRAQAWDEDTGLKEQQLRIINSQQQTNPRYGARGARVFFALPALSMAQIHAISAGADRALSRIEKVQPRILIPNVVAAEEASIIIEAIRTTMGSYRDLQVGIAIETPRAALLAAEIAQVADFLCIGSESLTETTFAYAREDGGKFLPAYAAHQIFHDPMQEFDVKGVGTLMTYAVQSARGAQPNITIGVCGAHADDVQALRLYSELELDYMSVDISQALTARLALAQATLANRSPAK